MPLEALIFDVDGTLAETEEAHREAFNATFRTFWLDWHWDQPLYRELLQVTGGKERIHHFITHWNPSGGQAVLSRINEMHAEKNAHYAHFLDKGMITPRPGIIRVIREAKARNIDLAIATTTSRENVKRLLIALFGSEDPSLFKVIGVGDMVKNKKPAPDIYLHVLSQLGHAASHCLAIEDSRNGIEAARHAGLTVLATPSAYSSHDNFSKADCILSELGEPSSPFKHHGGHVFDKTYVDVNGLEMLMHSVCTP